MTFSQDRIAAYHATRAAWQAARAISEGDQAPTPVCETHWPGVMRGKGRPACAACDKLRATYLGLVSETMAAHAAYRKALNSLNYWESCAVSSRADLREMARQAGIDC